MNPPHIALTLVTLVTDGGRVSRLSRLSPGQPTISTGGNPPPAKSLDEPQPKKK